MSEPKNAVVLTIRFAPPILDLRGNQHESEKEAEQANALYRLEDRLAALLMVAPEPVADEPPPRRRGRHKEPEKASALIMARELMQKFPGMGTTEAARRAVEACSPHENEIRKQSKISTLKRDLAPSGKRR